MRSPEYLALVRSLPCRIGAACRGRIEAHHSTHGRGMGQKASDLDTMPLCAKHHREFHDARGPFEMMNRDDRREWQRAQVHATQAALPLPSVASPDEPDPWADVF